MDIFDIDPNALIILVIMLIGGLKWLFERLKGEQPLDDEQSDSQAPFQDLYEEARREIRERQSRTAPPPEQQKQQSRPAIFKPLEEPPSSPAVPPPLPRTPSAASQPASFQHKSPVRPTLSTAEKAALDRLQREGLPSLRRRRGRRSDTRVRKLLASPSSTRDAIVLREILGPAKGAMWELADPQ